MGFKLLVQGKEDWTDLYSHLNFPLVSQTEEWKKKIQTRGVRWGPSADNSLPLAQKHTSAFTYVHYFTFEDCCKYFTMINNSKFWEFSSVQIIASKRLTEDQGFQVFCLFLCFLLLFVYVNRGHFCFHPNIQTPPRDVRGKSKSLGWKATPDLSFIYQAVEQLSEQPALWGSSFWGLVLPHNRRVMLTVLSLGKHSGQFESTGALWM